MNMQAVVNLSTSDQSITKVITGTTVYTVGVQYLVQDVIGFGALKTSLLISELVKLHRTWQDTTQKYSLLGLEVSITTDEDTKQINREDHAEDPRTATIMNFLTITHNNVMHKLMIITDGVNDIESESLRATTILMSDEY